MPAHGGTTADAATPAVAAVVLAAGRSTRMGAQNKLLADLSGRPMVRVVTETALGSRARPVLVVTGHMAAEVGAGLAGLGVTIVANPDYATGLASSVKAGIRAVPADCHGALILLGDMPRLTALHLDTLIDAFAAAPERVVVPVHRGRQGNPVLWPRRFFPELLQLDGDAGARRLLKTYRAEVQEVALDSTAILLDIDTPDALARARGSSHDG